MSNSRVIRLCLGQAPVLGAAAIGAIAAFFVPGCLERRDASIETADTACADCHGDPTRPGSSLARSAPPNDLGGSRGSSYPGVGAHAIHLSTSETHAPVPCDECHIVPERTDSPGHADDERPAELTFGSLASRNGHDPTYEFSTRTCTESYCHGEASPVWTKPRSSEKACGSCHGLPPAAPHPASEACHVCHAEVIDETGDFIRANLHVDGQVQLDLTSCTGCHGEGQNPAPPKDTRGETRVSAIGVGAHRAHLSGGTSSRPLECSECHAVPEDVDDRSHADGLPAEVELIGVSSTRNHEPTWNRTDATCSDTWCHGPNASNEQSPSWIAPEPLGCNGCHASPPPAPHPEADDCFTCHGNVVNEDREVIARALHVDGTVQIPDDGCVACHGSDDDPAPPGDLFGRTDPGVLGVGAHQAHLEGGDHGRPVPCEECHRVPSVVDDEGHLDAAPAEVRFRGAAIASDRDPSWDRREATCSETWCHGPSPSSTDESPSWIAPESLGCASCHGAPPPSPHPQISDCSLCHGDVVGTDDVTIVDRARHVDGTIDVNTDFDCTSCHGSNNPAPPPDTRGSTRTTDPGVGAHQTHVMGTARSRAVPCAECHLVPAQTVATGHLDTDLPAEVVFSGAAVAHGAQPSYTGTTCENTACHGAVLPRGHASGGTNTAPDWIRVDGTEAACGSCHALPPPRPHPVADLNPVCSACHENIAPDNSTFVRPELHVDGNVTFELPPE